MDQGSNTGGGYFNPNQGPNYVGVGGAQTNWQHEKLIAEVVNQQLNNELMKIQVELYKLELEERKQTLEKKGT